MTTLNNFGLKQRVMKRRVVGEKKPKLEKMTQLRMVYIDCPLLLPCKHLPQKWVMTSPSIFYAVVGLGGLGSGLRLTAAWCLQQGSTLLIVLVPWSGLVFSFLFVCMEYLQFN